MESEVDIQMVFIFGKALLVLLTMPLLVVAVLLKWFAVFLHSCSAWVFYILAGVLFAVAVFSWLAQTESGMEVVRMLVGSFMIFMVPQIIGGFGVIMERFAGTLYRIRHL